MLRRVLFRLKTRSRGNQAGKADVVIMTPPFTRQERLPKKYKETLMKRLSEYRFTRQDGRIALVLPATVLRVESTRKVRELLVNKTLNKNSLILQNLILHKKPLNILIGFSHYTPALLILFQLPLTFPYP